MFDLVARRIVSEDPDRRALLIKRRHGVGSGRASGGVLVEVLDEALDGDVRDPPDDIEVVAMDVAVEHGADLAAPLEHLPELATFSHEREMGEPSEPERVGQVLLACRVVHENDDRQRRLREIVFQPLELRMGDPDLDVLALERMELVI